MSNKSTHILMTGGGTLGPVIPLISIVEEWKKQNPRARVSWIGTKTGPEREVVEERRETFYELFAPKLSRHKKWTWPFVPILFAYSLVRAFILLLKIQPDVIFTAGGFVSIPVVVMGKLLGIPSWVHQLDVEAGIANKIMAKFAKKVSVTFIESESAFPVSKTIVVGGILPVRALGGDRKRFVKDFALHAKKPTLFVIGGGTGAIEINNAMEVIGEELLEEMNVIHLTGPRKMTEKLENMPQGYWAQEFMNQEIKHAYAIADVVVSRAGLGTMLALIGLKKASVIVPIMNSHQEDNAKILTDRGAAKVILNMTPQLLKQEIYKLIRDDVARRDLGEAMGRVISLRAQQKIVEEARGWVS